MREFGEGPVSRFAAFAYTFLVVELMLLVSAAPALVLLMLLGRDASNIPLAAVCVLPLGPAISAALYALRHHRRDLTDLKPAAAYLRGYRLNLSGVLKIWVPWLVLLSI